ncbi:MAG TPA: response regulator [Gammaproteobacteria bacterium]|nr:response regulator [Gammaproteobacteria bacterium]
MTTAEPGILIVNTDRRSRSLLRQTLEQNGFSKISEAESGTAAIEILNLGAIDILITDIGLSDLDGWRLTRLVRSGVLKTAADTPIIIVSTTYSERIAEITAREFSVNRFINFEELHRLPAVLRDIQAGGSTLPRPALLLIEDHPDTTQLVKRVLEQRFDIETAADGKSGLEFWNARRHDLVLLDIMLPVKSGEQVLAEMLEEHPNQAIVVMTAHSSAARASSLLLGGAVDFIAKPFRAEQLRHVCDIAVRREDFIVSNEQFSRRLSELQKNEEKYRRLVEALSEDHFFYTFNREGNFTYISPSITRVLGYSEPEFLTSCTTYLSENIVNRNAAQMRTLSMKGVQQAPYEIEIIHKNGAAHRLEVTESPVFDEQGVVIAVDGIAHDVTERIQMQNQLRQAQKMEAIGQLTGGIAHDFNNILGSILGYTSLAQQKLPTDGDRKLAGYLAEVYRAGERARDLISQMLAFSRGSATQSQAMELTPLVKECVKMMRSTLPATIDLLTDIADELPAVMMDTVQLHQLVMNLCINARDAIENEKGCIELSLHTATGIRANCSSCHHPIQGNFVELVTQDNGQGIDASALPRIFDPFFTTKDIGKGTGMGLSMVHGIVHGHGGHILVDSIPGKGTSFRLLFPLIGITGLSTTGRESSPEPVRGSGHVMVVDDDPSLTLYLKELLQERGYRVTALTDARAALDLFEQDPAAVDLLLTDQTMPKLAGDQLAQAMLARRPDLPVILCTGYSDRIDAETAGQLNIRGYFTKPVDPDKLTRLMNNLLATG